MPQATSENRSKKKCLASLIWLGIAGLAWLILTLLAPVLMPFVIALVLAYTLAPVVDLLLRASRYRLPRWLIVFLVEMVFLLLLFAVTLLIVPILSKELPLLKAQLPLLIQRLNTLLSPLLSSFGLTFILDPLSIKNFVITYLEANASDVWTSVAPSLKLGGGVLLSLLGLVMLVPLALFYLLCDWVGLWRRVAVWIPPGKLPSVQSFILEADLVLGQYTRGQLLVMLILAAFYSIGLALWGLDLALPIGVFTGLAMCIPYVGFGLGLILAMLAGVLQFDLAHTALMLVSVYGAGQVLESLFLTPRLVGERIGLHPLVVIFALLAFGQIFGFIGVLVALPVSALLLVAFRRFKTSYLASPLYLM